MTIDRTVDDGRERKGSRVTTPTPRALVISDADHELISEMGRLEDVAVSPSGRTMALAGFEADRIAVLDLDTSMRSEPSLTVPRVRLLSGPSITRPHGLDFLDDDRIIVANRTGAVCAVVVPRGPGPESEVESLVIADANSEVGVIAPGSVAARRSASRHADVVVCDNDGHTVNRYVVDADEPSRVLHASVIAAAELRIPDGVAIDPSGRWMAISNHDLHQVWLYRFDGVVSEQRMPVGVLEGVNFPHGLSFTLDGSALVVADAGLPYTTVFEAEDGDWTGERHPARVIRVLDDDQFRRGRVNLTEGGMKGVALAGDVVAFVGNLGGLQTFDAADILGPDFVATVDPATDDVRRGPETTAHQLVEHAYGAVRVTERERMAAEEECDRLRERLDEHDGHLQGAVARIADLERELEAVRRMMADMRASNSWRITQPLRSIADRVRTRQ